MVQILVWKIEGLCFLPSNTINLVRCYINHGSHFLFLEYWVRNNGFQIEFQGILSTPIKSSQGWRWTGGSISTPAPSPLPFLLIKTISLQSVLQVFHVFFKQILFEKKKITGYKLKIIDLFSLKDWKVYFTVSPLLV